MDFLRYAESGAALLNADPVDLDSLGVLLAGRTRLQEQATARDAKRLTEFAARLRPVFAASDEGRVPDVVAGLNALLAEHPVTPQISDHDPAGLHLHAASGSAAVSDLLIAEMLLGLATLVCDLGPTRLGVCSAAPCRQAYLDTSPNRSRRYCSDRCSSRANVAAYRARQRAGAR